MLETFSISSLLWVTGVTRYWVVLVALYGAYENQQLDRRAEAAKIIVTGASEKEVSGILGAPGEKWEKSGPISSLFGKVPAKWSYGPTVDFDLIFAEGELFPNTIPFRFRFFGPYERDLTIEWTDDRTVASVKFPKQPHR